MIVLNDTEKEIVILKASIEIIDSIANHAILDLHHNDPDSEIIFKTEIIKNILAYFLSTLYRN